VSGLGRRMAGGWWVTSPCIYSSRCLAGTLLVSCVMPQEGRNQCSYLTLDQDHEPGPKKNLSFLVSCLPACGIAFLPTENGLRQTLFPNCLSRLHQEAHMTAVPSKCLVSECLRFLDEHILQQKCTHSRETAFSLMDLGLPYSEFLRV
jgi:hypothetical protein